MKMKRKGRKIKKKKQDLLISQVTELFCTLDGSIHFLDNITCLDYQIRLSYQYPLAYN